MAQEEVGPGEPGAAHGIGVSLQLQDGWRKMDAGAPDRERRPLAASSWAFLRRRWRWVALGACSLPLAAFALLTLSVWAYSCRTHASPTDVAIVLGAAVWDDRPSPVFEERIKHAIALHEASRVGAIIFTGGRAEPDRRSESAVARAYALAHGVPTERIRCEAVSTSTYENLAEAARIMYRERWEKAVVVSDPLHMRRAMAMALEAGIDAFPSPTPTSRYRSWRTKTAFLLSEAYLYGRYLLGR